MAVVVSIGGTDYGPGGEGVVLVSGGLQLEQAGRNRIGTATIRMSAPAGNGYTILDKDEVQIYIDDPTSKCLFGGFVSHRTTWLEKGTTQEFWEIQCQDYNLLLDTITHPAAEAQKITVPADTFKNQIQYLVLEMQQAGTIVNPPLLINTEDYITDIAAALPSFIVKGQSMRQALDQLMLNATASNAALRPHYHLTLLPDGLGGQECCLVAYDGAAPPSSVGTFSDNPGVGEHGIFSFKRVLDGASLANRQQAIYGDPTVQIITSTDSTSVAQVNRYVNHGRTLNTGYWQDAPVQDKESTSLSEAQARLDALVLAKSQPRETIELVEDGVFVRPGDTVTVEFASEGLATDYSVAGVGVEFITPDMGNVRYTLSLGLPLRELLEGEAGIQGPPVEHDIIPPDAPTSFALDSNVYNPQSGQTEITFTWAASPSADVAGYKLYYYASGGYVPVDVGAALTGTLKYEPGASYEVYCRAYDGSGNHSDATATLTGTAADRPPYEGVFNPSFEILATSGAEVAAGWTAELTGAGSTATRVTTEHAHGTASVKLTVTGTTTEIAYVVSDAFSVEPNTVYWWRFNAKNAAISDNAHAMIRWYNDADTLISEDWLISPTTVNTSWQLIECGATGGPTSPATAASARLVLGNAMGSVATDLYIDNVAFGTQTRTPQLEDASVTAGKVTSGAAADGYVLTADGAGGAAWEAAAGGGGAILETIIDAKGDLIAGTAADTAARLAVGTDGQVLTADSAETTGLKWATPAALSAVEPTLQRWFVDGRLAALTRVGGRFVAPENLTVDGVYITAGDKGTASSTIVDVNRNGWTIFTTQANRPTLAYDAAEPWAVGTPDGNILYAGDQLSIDIDQVATGAAGLGVTVALVTGTDPGGTALPDEVYDDNKIGSDTDNRALNVGAGGAWDQTKVLHPCAVEHLGTIYLFYAGYNGSAWKIGVATAPTDGFTGVGFTKYASNPILSGGAAGTWDENHVADPFVMYDHDAGVWKMWYRGMDTSAGTFGIGYATASSPFGPWTKYASNPVLTNTEAWEGNYVFLPSVLKEGASDYKMLYTGNEPASNNGRIGLATSSDGISWTKYASNPVLSPSGAGWMAASVFSSRTLIKAGSTYYVLFSGKSSSVGFSKSGYSTSSDLHSFTLSTNNPLLSATRAWESGETENPNALYLGGKYYIFYDAWYGGAIGVAGVAV